MTLEDSLGDILRKARTSTQISDAAAAQAAGLSLADYGAMESSGQAAPGTDFPKLGTLLTLDGAKLERVAKGWLPAPADLGTWRALRVLTTAGDDMTVNAFLVWDEATREAAGFDTGFTAGPMCQLIEEHQLQLRHIFITHSHADHVAGLGELRRRFPQARVHSGSPHAPVEQRLRPDECVSLGSLQITHRDTPGHAEDGVTFIVGNWPDAAPLVAIVGDCIFAGSMGGAREQLALARNRVRDHVLSLPPDTLICPGHGPVTTVAQEKANNPWFP